MSPFDVLCAYSELARIVENPPKRFTAMPTAREMERWRDDIIDALDSVIDAYNKLPN